MSDVFLIKKGDTSPGVLYAITPTDIILTGATVVFSMRKTLANTNKVDRASATVVTATGTPTLGYDWQAGDTDTAGVFNAEFEVTYSDGTIETFPNDGYIVVRIDEDLD